MRERVPEGRDGFVGFVLGDFTSSRRSARAGLLVEFSEQCDVGRIVPSRLWPVRRDIVLVDADPVHGGDARVGGGEGDDGYAGGVEDQLRGWGHQCVTVLGYSGIQIGLGSTELDSGPHRPAPGCLVNRYNRVVLYVTRSDRRIPASVTSVPRTFLRIPN